MNLLGVILASGAGRRMGGRHKGLLAQAADKTIVAHIESEMQAAGLDQVVLISNSLEPYAETGLTALPDLRPGNGPMGGIEAGLAYAQARGLAGALFMPCDMPRISSIEISKLKREWLKSQAGIVTTILYSDQEPYMQMHPLCSVVAVRHLQAVSQSIDEGKLKIRWLWEDLSATNVHFTNAIAFLNLNTNEELEAWLRDTIA